MPRVDPILDDVSRLKFWPKKDKAPITITSPTLVKPFTDRGEFVIQATRAGKGANGYEVVRVEFGTEHGEPPNATRKVFGNFGVLLFNKPFKTYSSRMVVLEDKNGTGHDVDWNNKYIKGFWDKVKEIHRPCGFRVDDPGATPTIVLQSEDVVWGTDQAVVSQKEPGDLFDRSFATPLMEKLAKEVLAEILNRKIDRKNTVVFVSMGAIKFKDKDGQIWDSDLAAFQHRGLVWLPHKMPLQYINPSDALTVAHEVLHDRTDDGKRNENIIENRDRMFIGREIVTRHWRTVMWYAKPGSGPLFTLQDWIHIRAYLVRRD
jgi:hypothetical protein